MDISQFDLIISMRPFSNWGSGERQVLAHTQKGWHKIKIQQSGFLADSSSLKISILKMSPEKGDSMFKILKENHLFEMQDERSIKLPCNPKPVIVEKNGKKTTYFETLIVSDGAEYEFEIVTEQQYKRVYFYAPEDFYNFCPDAKERKWIINCIKVFEKYFQN